MFFKGRALPISGDSKPEKENHIAKNIAETQQKNSIIKSSTEGKGSSTKLIREKKKLVSATKSKFSIGDSVVVFPQKEKGIIFALQNDEGGVGVQIKGRKKWIKAKRIKLLVPASQLYPPDYDFSIIFDSVANRKARHDMNRKKTDLVASYENEEEAKWRN